MVEVCAETPRHNAATPPLPEPPHQECEAVGVGGGHARVAGLLAVRSGSGLVDRPLEKLQRQEEGQGGGVRMLITHIH